MRECNNPPCIHVVFDPRKKIYAIFFEDSEGTIIWVEKEKIEKAYEELAELQKKHFKEASAQEIDGLAAKYLNARPEESWETGE